MKSEPSIHFSEFVKHTTISTTQDNCQLFVREHPEFGKWQQKTFDLKYFTVTEHKTSLTQEINVTVADDALTDRVNHCMCVDGSLGAHFDVHRLKADLHAGNYHFMTVQANEYRLAMSTNFHNIHIQLTREYYTDLLSDDEAWSAELKERIHMSEVCYPGHFSSTPGMSRTISDIFNSPLTGSLKKLMIEAKVLELIALQWNTSLSTKKEKTTGKGRNMMFDIRDYLEQNFLADHSLKGICLKFGVNEFALKNGFRETFKTTVFDFILTRRLQHAHGLLLSGDFSIQEVGSIVGYKYANHFSTAFKNKFGITPGKLKD